MVDAHKLPLPLSVKLIFFCYLWGVVVSLFGISSILISQSFWKIANFFIQDILAILLLYGIWTRKKWTWNLGLCNSALTLVSVGYVFLNFESIKREGIAAAMNGANPTHAVAFVPKLYIATGILTGVFAFFSATIFYRNRNLF